MKTSKQSAIEIYKILQSKFGDDVTCAANRGKLTDCVIGSINELRDKNRIALISRVPGKDYFAFSTASNYEGLLTQAYS